MFTAKSSTIISQLAGPYRMSLSNKMPRKIKLDPSRIADKFSALKLREIESPFLLLQIKPIDIKNELPAEEGLSVAHYPYTIHATGYKTPDQKYLFAAFSDKPLQDMREVAKPQEALIGIFEDYLIPPTAEKIGLECGTLIIKNESNKYSAGLVLHNGDIPAQILLQNNLLSDHKDYRSEHLFYARMLVTMELELGALSTSEVVLKHEFDDMGIFYFGFAGLDFKGVIYPEAIKFNA